MIKLQNALTLTLSFQNASYNWL